jgi:hypothetical protein
MADIQRITPSLQVLAGFGGKISGRRQRDAIAPGWP